MTTKIFTKRFIKYICLLIFSFLFCFLFSINLEASTIGQKSEKIFLWEVRSKTATVYLLGSLHVFKKTMYPLDQAINDAYEKSDILVVEVDITKMNEEEINKIMQQEGMYVKEETLEKNLSDETLKSLKEYLRDNSMTLEQVNKLKPWFLNLHITSQEMKKLGYDPQYGIDQYFLTKAKGNKTILELETFDEQLEMMSAGTKQEQDLLLRLTLENLPEMQQILNKMIDAWLVGDADSLIDIEREEAAKYPELQSYLDRLLNERNMKMVKEIKEYLNTDGTCFVVVGAFHVGGEKGIINLLKNDKYTVKLLVKSPLKPSISEVPEILKPLDYKAFFPDGYESWKLYENKSEDETVTLGWTNKEGHELELIYKKASHRTIQNVYLNLGKEVDNAVKEKGGQIAVAQEYYALAFINESEKLVSVNLLYGTVDGVYLWKYKVPIESKSNIDKFVERLTFIARKQQYEKAFKAGNVIMGHWGKPVHEYARLLAKAGDPQTENIYTNLLQTSPADYEAHIEFTSITKNKDKILESAKIVRRYAEDEKLLSSAAKILGENPSDINALPLVSEKDNGLRVILIPLPPYNPWILKEIAETYEVITTIPVSIKRLPNTWNLPPPSRSPYRPYLERIASQVIPDKANFSDWSLDKLRKELMTKAEKEGPQAVSFLKDIYKKIDEGGGQWDADPLLFWLSEALVPYISKDPKTMYVGITELDVYSGDSNFVFSVYGGLPESPVSVLSYARMKVAFTGEKQSRRRLVERASKELVPATLKRLGIPRSVDPSCPYSYADGLERLDEKTLKLSDLVTEQIQKIGKSVD